MGVHHGERKVERPYYGTHPQRPKPSSRLERAYVPLIVARPTIVKLHCRGQLRRECMYLRRCLPQGLADFVSDKLGESVAVLTDEANELTQDI